MSVGRVRKNEVTVASGLQASAETLGGDFRLRVVKVRLRHFRDPQH
jgi:hypothetical protein